MGGGVEVRRKRLDVENATLANEHTVVAGTVEAALGLCIEFVCSEKMIKWQR